MTQKYPLDPLRRVRAENVDQKARALSEAVRQADEARQDVERREQSKRELDRTLAAAADAERELLERGVLTAGDVARGAAWGVAAEMERAAQARAVEQARAAHLQRVVQADDVRSALAVARTSADLVERHHRGWEKARQVEATARDEENAEDAHRARATRRGAT